MGETGSVLIAQASWSWLGTLSRAGGCGLSSVKLLLSPGADFIKLRVEPSDFGIQFDETQAGGHHQLLSLYASIILEGAGFHAHAGGWLLGRWIPLQVQEIET
jgi:hypothetical protein